MYELFYERPPPVHAAAAGTSRVGDRPLVQSFSEDTLRLQSQLFMNDATLEAAAVSDQAHITQGARGDHVRKIQLALIRLDQASIRADGVYGPGTAAAVLAY